MTPDNLTPYCLPSPTDRNIPYNYTQSKSNAGNARSITPTTSISKNSYIPTSPEPDNEGDFKAGLNYTKIKKVYPCSQCTKQFNRPSALETHSYTHSLEKPFQCLSPNCGRKFSVVSNLRRHFKVHQKQSLSCNKITSQERLRCVRQLIKKKPSDDGSTSINQDIESKLSDHTIPGLDEAHSQHYFLQTPMIETNTLRESIHVEKESFQEMTRTQVESPLYYRLPYSWTEQSSAVDTYNNEEKTIVHDNHLSGTDNDVPSSVLTTFGEFSF